MSTKQVALVTRWNYKVADSATRLLALSCFDNNRFVSGNNAIEDDCLSFGSLNLEFTAEVIDTFHEYCFFLRKLIERTGQVKKAQDHIPHTGTKKVMINKGGIDEFEAVLCDKSLWWILGRVIHSKEVRVLGGDTSNLIVYPDGKTREYDDGMCYLEVSSDYDNDGESHFLHIPSLVRAYTFSEIGRVIDHESNRNTI